MTFAEDYSTEGNLVVRTVTLGDQVHRTTVPDLSELPDTDPAWSRWWRSFLRGGTPSYGALGRSLRLVDLFGGCGGLAYGVREAARAVGLDATVLAVADLDDEGLEAYAQNLAPRNVLHTDVSKAVSYQIHDTGREAEFAYPPELLNEALTELVGQVDLLVAGPPCEGHSNLNNQTRRNDPRNLLYLDAVAIAVALRPTAVIIENVPDVVNDHKGVVQTGMGLLQKAGYSLNGDVLSANDFGLPQTRRRYFLVGIRGATPSLAEVEAALGGRASDLAWSIKDLADKDDPLNIEVEQSPETRRRIDWLFDNKKYDLADHMRPDSHKDGHTYGSVYGRLKWDEPAGTITTGFLTMGRGRYVHPSKRRTLTPREAARIQGFPDSYSFRLQSGAVPSKKSLTKWIGDAVPPILAYAAAMAVMPAFVDAQTAGHQVTKATRARMQAVKRANTAPEALVRQMLREQGIAFDTNKRGLPGTPDLVFREEKVAVFVHGCYWHRHEDCDLATMPKTNVEFWLRKFEQNKLRDKRTAGALRKAGWHPFVIWQCELEKDASAELSLLKEILAQRAAGVVGNVRKAARGKRATAGNTRNTQSGRQGPRRSRA